MSDDRLCANVECCKALVQKTGESDKAYRRRITCDPRCGAKAGHQRHVALYGPRNANGDYIAPKDAAYDWPAITGEFTGSFEGMDVKPSDNYLARLDRPANVNQSGSGNAAVRCTE